MFEPEERIVANEHSGHDEQRQHPDCLEEGPADPELDQDIKQPEYGQQEPRIQNHSIGVIEGEAVEVDLQVEQTVAEQHQR